MIRSTSRRSAFSGQSFSGDATRSSRGEPYRAVRQAAARPGAARELERQRRRAATARSPRNRGDRAVADPHGLRSSAHPSGSHACITLRGASYRAGMLASVAPGGRFQLAKLPICKCLISPRAQRRFQLAKLSICTCLTVSDPWKCYASSLVGNVPRGAPSERAERSPLPHEFAVTLYSVQSVLRQTAARNVMH